jgi:hypothetical protein
LAMPTPPRSRRAGADAKASYRILKLYPKINTFSK